MLKQIEAHLVFASTGKQITFSHALQPGLTAITGPNEVGKSLRLEMIRFALFGAKALRTSLKAYKRLSVELQFTLGGKDYTVSRTGSGANLSVESGGALAVGTAPVNKAIVELFGYGLDVFDTTNCILQKRTEALTSKTPAERRRMVDKTLGLDAIDEMITEVHKEAFKTEGFIKATEEFLKTPLGEKPAQPEGYMPSEKLKEQIEEVSGRVNRLMEIEATLRASAADAVAPVKPEGEEVTDAALALLETERRRYDDTCHKRNGLQASLFEANERVNKLKNKISSFPEVIKDLSQETLTRYVSEDIPEQHLQRQKWEKTRAESPAQNVSRETIIETEKALERIASEDSRILKIKELEKNSRLECPHCSGEIFLEQAEIDRLKEGLDLSGEAEEQRRRVYEGAGEAGLLLASERKKLLQAIEKHESFLSLDEPPTPPVSYIGETRQVRDYLECFDRLAVTGQDLESIRQDLEMTEASLLGVNDPGPALEAARKAQEAWREYRRRTERHLAWKAQEGPLLQEKASLEGSPALLEQLQDLRVQCSVYENNLENYAEREHARHTHQLSLKENQEGLDRLRKVKAALTGLKPMVKSYLMPSLNRVASNLLSQMTNGERSKVEIDENFEILIDGQKVEELSGSGEAVANLSIRLALGTVLTNNIFSVLLADEIDSSMNKERAAATAACLRNLKDTIKQILLVSHQKPEADYQIEL